MFIHFPGLEPGSLGVQRSSGWSHPATLWNVTGKRRDKEELLNPAMPASSLPSSFSLTGAGMFTSHSKKFSKNSLQNEGFSK